VTVIVAEIKLRLTTNIIFTTAVMSLPSWKYWFAWLQKRHFISTTKIRYRWISVFYTAPTLTLFFGYFSIIDQKVFEMTEKD